MHPEIEQDGPGACPKCGMDLEPKYVVADVEDDDSELRNMTRRFCLAVALAIPVLLLAMFANDWCHARNCTRNFAMDSVAAQHTDRVLGRMAVFFTWLAVVDHVEFETCSR